MVVLAIESSCDETAVAIVEGDSAGVRVISHEVASSALMHQKSGGIIPEVAAREQLKAITPLLSMAVEQAFGEGGVKDLVQKRVDLVAVTVSPGLVGSLLVGVEAAKVLGWVCEKPVVSVDHLEGHIAAAWIKKSEEEVTPLLPAVAMVVSGGHSEFVVVDQQWKIKRVGGTRDDAAGECLDKCGRLVGLGYPAGALVAEHASRYRERLKADLGYVMDSRVGRWLPRPMWNSEDHSVSFSGLKVAMQRMCEEMMSESGKVEVERACFELEEAVVAVLVKQAEQLVSEFAVKSLVVGGGVAANGLLRKRLLEVGERAGVEVFIPDLEWCTDNAAMIGARVLVGPVQAVKNEAVAVHPSRLRW